MTAGDLEGGPLHGLGSELIDHVPAMLEEIGSLLADEYPEYARVIAKEFAEITAVAGYVGRFVGSARDGRVHLDALIFHQDEAILAALRRQCLAPLAGLSPSARERLVTTLRSWLMHMGDRKAAAADLHVHPQTVAYRVARLRVLFGPSLDNATVRANLLVRLGWEPEAEAPANAVALGGAS